MKAIFLDVDGVLNNNHTRTVTFDGWCFVDDYLVARLARLVRESGAKIILSSTWRDGWNRADETLNEPFFNQLRDKLKSYGMEIWDALPLPMCPRRSQAIQVWFDGHRHLDIESYVILDDGNDMDQFTSHFVWINPRYGIRDEDIIEALRILDNKI